jgi:hypothetical protein
VAKKRRAGGAKTMPKSMNSGARPPSSASSSSTATKTNPGGQRSTATTTRPRPRPTAVTRARKAKRTSSWWWAAILALVVAVGGIAIVAVGGGSGNSSSAGSSTGSTGPQLAAADTNITGQPVNGIECLGSEQLKFHDHAHLSIFVDGAQRTVPAFIGIAPDGSCLYWLHSHTPDGVIHMESPIQRSFTLADYFDIWGQPLSSTQVGPAKGTVTAFVDGKRFNGDPRTIKLAEHANIQLDVGKVVPFKNYTYAEGL